MPCKFLLYVINLRGFSHNNDSYFQSVGLSYVSFNVIRMSLDIDLIELFIIFGHSISQTQNIVQREEKMSHFMILQ